MQGGGIIWRGGSSRTEKGHKESHTMPHTFKTC